MPRRSSRRKDRVSSPEVSRTIRPTRLVVGLVLVVATVIVFAQVAGHGLLDWDDHQHLDANPHLDPLSWGGLAELWGGPYFGMYVPLTYSYYAGLAWVSAVPLGTWTESSFSPAVFHVGSLALHVGCVLAVFALLYQLVRDPLTAGCGAALFAIHPVQVESIAWVSEARGLLSALLGVSALILLIRSLQDASEGTQQAESPPRPRRWLLLCAATTLFAGALLAKPSAVALPPIAVVLLWGWYGTITRPLLVTLGVWFVMAVGLTLITQSQQPTDNIRYVPTLVQRPIVVGHTLAFYTATVLWPDDLTPIYGQTPERVLGEAGAAGFYVVPLLAAGVLWFAWRRPGWRPLAVALGIALLAVLPVSGVLPFNYQNISTVADRYLYMAMLGPAILVAWLIARRETWQPATRVVVFSSWGVLILLLATLAYRQSEHWHSNVTLWTHALEIDDENLIARGHLATALAAQGDSGAALRHFQIVLKHRSTPEAVNNVAWTLATAGDARYRDGAQAVAYAETVCEPPRDKEPTWLDTLAAAYAEAGRYEDAVQTARRAIELAEAGGRPSLASDIRSRLELYEQGQPYHQ